MVSEETAWNLQHSHIDHAQTFPRGARCKLVYTYVTQFVSRDSCHMIRDFRSWDRVKEVSPYAGACGRAVNFYYSLWMW